MELTVLDADRDLIEVRDVPVTLEINPETLGEIVLSGDPDGPIEIEVSSGPPGIKGEKGDPGPLHDVIEGAGIGIDKTNTDFPVINADVITVAGKVGNVIVTKSDVGLGNADNTSDADKPISNAAQLALNGKEPTITAGISTQYWRGDKTWQILDKASVGLNNVDNTTDANKPVSTATQTALNLKANLASPTFTGTVGGITKSMVGLSAVDNTSDADKPVSTATQAALNLKANTSSLAAIATSGSASDLTTGTIPTAVLPPLAINEVSTVGSQAAMLALTAQRGDMAIRTDNGRTYVLSTDSPSTLADWKEIAAASQVTSVNGYTGAITLTKSDVGLANVDNTSDANKPISSATQTALNLKANLASPTFTGTVGGITKSMVGLANVDNTSDAAKPVSTAQQTALDLKAPLASPTFTGTVSGITKSMVGLANVDNTSDANKPVSTAQQTALNLKANLASPTFTGTVSGITKTMVGLGNVDNTSDLNKPISTATQTALDDKAQGRQLLTDSKAATDNASTYAAGLSVMQVSTGITGGWPEDLGVVITDHQNINRGLQTFVSKGGNVYTRTPDSALTNGWSPFRQGGNVVRVVHGATASTARPAFAQYVEWVGSVLPTNSIANDTWVNTS